MPCFTKKHKVLSSVYSNGIFYLVNVSSYKFRLGSDEGSNVSFCSEGGIKGSVCFSHPDQVVIWKTHIFSAC